MTTFFNVNQPVALNNNIAAMGHIFNIPVYSNPGQTNGVIAAFPGVICYPSLTPYWGAGGAIANVGVIWRGPFGDQVSLEILDNETKGSDEPKQTVSFTAGKWSDANIATLEEAAATIRKTLDVPGGGVSDDIRVHLTNVLNAIETELIEKLSQ